MSKERWATRRMAFEADGRPVASGQALVETLQRPFAPRLAVSIAMWAALIAGTLQRSPGALRSLARWSSNPAAPHDVWATAITLSGGKVRLPQLLPPPLRPQPPQPAGCGPLSSGPMPLLSNPADARCGVQHGRAVQLPSRTVAGGEPRGRGAAGCRRAAQGVRLRVVGGWVAAIEESSRVACSPSTCSAAAAAAMYWCVYGSAAICRCAGEQDQLVPPAPHPCPSHLGRAHPLLQIVSGRRHVGILSVDPVGSYAVK